MIYSSSAFRAERQQYTPLAVVLPRRNRYFLKTMIAFDDMGIGLDYIKYNTHHIFLPVQNYPFYAAGITWNTFDSSSITP